MIIKKCMLPLLVAFPATVLACAPADPFKYPDEYTTPYNQSEWSKASPYEMALSYKSNTEQFSMIFCALRSDRLIKFLNGDTPKMWRFLVARNK